MKIFSNKKSFFCTHFTCWTKDDSSPKKNYKNLLCYHWKFIIILRHLCLWEMMLPCPGKVVKI